MVRLSGPAAGRAIQKLAGALPAPRKASLRTLKAIDGEVIDQAMVLWFPGPHSATGEDVAEFHLHGSPAVIALLFSNWRRLPQIAACRSRENFPNVHLTNGKLDLVEAEGLADLLSATTPAQRRLAMRQFLGEASKVYEAWHADVVSALALAEAAIDFIEEDDVASRAREMVFPIIEGLRDQLQQALDRSASHASLRQGLRIVIAGAPNVGKSSLLNVLAGRDAAIVSDQAGTTRDVIEAPVVIEGVPVILADTAGLRDATLDVIEEIGMARAQAQVADADILIWMRAPDVSEKVGPLRAPDLMLWNKSDLDSIRKSNEKGMAISTRSGLGLDLLRQELHKMIQMRMRGVEDAVVIRQRHREAVAESIRLLNNCLAQRERAVELLAEDLRKTARSLGRITGRVDVEDLLGKIFGEFCIGK